MIGMTPSGTSSPVQRRTLDARLRRLTVQRVTDLSASLRRVELAGPELAGFECDGPTDHAKVFFPAEPGGEPSLPDAADAAGGRQDPRYVCRDYTVRTYVPSSDALVLDMAVHPHGPAGRWAAAAEPGHVLGVYGPKTTKIPPLDRDWYVLAADETGLPALANWLDRLPTGPTVHALVEVAGPDDEVELPGQVAVTWLHRGDAEAGTTDLLATAASGAFGAVQGTGGGWVWAGAEASVVRALRGVAVAHGVEKRSLSMTGYWRRGVANFDHKAPEPE